MQWPDGKYAHASLTIYTKKCTLDASAGSAESAAVVCSHSLEGQLNAEALVPAEFDEQFIGPVATCHATEGAWSSQCSLCPCADRAPHCAV
eukprot:scaffold91919_cov19-Tisochrysis_lutea.AAC.1